jgi:hypothetical protein
VKAKLVFAIVLVLLGTNLFTYATTRYTTTRTVLTRAQQRLKDALTAEGLYEQVFVPTDRPRSIPVQFAISQAGGSYYWWNDGLVYWGAAGVLTISGLLVPLVRPRRRDATA